MTNKSSTISSGNPFTFGSKKVKKVKCEGHNVCVGLQRERNITYCIYLIQLIFELCVSSSYVFLKTFLSHTLSEVFFLSLS